MPFNEYLNKEMAKDQMSGSQGRHTELDVNLCAFSKLTIREQKNGD